MVQVLGKTSWKFLSSFKYKVPYDPAIQFLDIDQREIKHMSTQKLVLEST